MFVQTAAFYDAIYTARGKSYAREADAIARLVRARLGAGRTTLLDVGCGTGAHLAEFERLGFEVSGIDADPKMVALARARCPEVPVDFADMTTFALGKRFDVITCLFGTAAYARVARRLDATLLRLAAHLEPGGIVLLEPFVPFRDYRAGTLDAVFVDEPKRKIARMSLSKQVGRIAIIDFNYLVATPLGVERFFERHELGLFDEGTYRMAFEAAGIDFGETGLEPDVFSRGLYLGTSTVPSVGPPGASRTKRG